MVWDERFQIPVPDSLHHCGAHGVPTRVSIGIISRTPNPEPACWSPERNQIVGVYGMRFDSSNGSIAKHALQCCLQRLWRRWVNFFVPTLHFKSYLYTKNYPVYKTIPCVRLPIFATDKAMVTCNHYHIFHPFFTPQDLCIHI